MALTPIVQQTAFWAEVKSYQGIESKAFDFKVKNSEVYVDDLTKTSTYADLLILQQALNKDTSIAYVPYGPELEPSEEMQGEFLEELSEILRSYLPKSCIGIRYDLLPGNPIGTNRRITMSPIPGKVRPTENTRSSV